MKVSSAEFEFFHNHLVLVPVTLNNEVKARFALDTGAGIDLISEELCEKLHCRETGLITGKRMSGEEFAAPLSEVGSLEMAGYRRLDQPVGVTDIFSKLPEEWGGIDGAISLKFFENQPFTIDFPDTKVIVESLESAAAIRKDGKVFALRRKENEHTLDIFMDFYSGDTKLGSFEVDTGCLEVVVNITKAEQLKINLHSSDVIKQEGKNETGYPFVKYITEIDRIGARTIDGELVQQERPIAIINELIYDGVIGNDFLGSYKFTVDLTANEVILR